MFDREALRKVTYTKGPNGAFSIMAPEPPDPRVMRHIRGAAELAEFHRTAHVIAVYGPGGRIAKREPEPPGVV